MTSNYRLPNDADRCNLERHLSDADFQLVFEVSFFNWERNYNNYSIVFLVKQVCQT